MKFPIGSIVTVEGSGEKYLITHQINNGTVNIKLIEVSNPQNLAYLNRAWSYPISCLNSNWVLVGELPKPFSDEEYKEFFV